MIARNTIGTPSFTLGAGPFGRALGSTEPAADVDPPHGIGSLQIATAADDKFAFGNEKQFAGLELSAITALKFWVYPGLDQAPTSADLPNIVLEIDPGISGAGYSSLQFLPASAEQNTWNEIDALGSAGGWYISNSTARAAAGCANANLCSWSEVLAGLPDASVSYSLGVSKVLSGPVVAAIDALQVNGEIYDFEPSGVEVLPIP